MARRAQGEGSVYLAADGRWHASLSLGRDPAGRRRRRHVQAASQREVVCKLQLLRQSTTPGGPTMGEWSAAWLAIIERTCKPSTARAYRTHLRYLRDIDTVPLVEVTPEHLEVVYGGLARRGVTASTIVSVHRTIRSCLAEAVRRGHLARNPALIARPPRADAREIYPLSVGEVRAVLATADGQRNMARWHVALMLGLRQGEALGLQWVDIDLEGGMLHVRRAIQRGSWRHGCSSAGCGAAPHRCPGRHGGGLIVTSPKSISGHRTVALSSVLVSAFAEHRRTQELERLVAGDNWADSHIGRVGAVGGGWVFATPAGQPIDPKRDWSAWHGLLAAAGVRRARLHDARHTAATLLLQVGTDVRTVMELLGWTQPVMLMRYQHVIDPHRRDAARRIGALIWGGPDHSQAAQASARQVWRGGPARGSQRRYDAEVAENEAVEALSDDERIRLLQAAADEDRDGRLLRGSTPDEVRDIIASSDRAR